MLEQKDLWIVLFVKITLRSSGVLSTLLPVGAKAGKEKAVEKLFIAGNLFDVLQVTRIARYNLHSTSSADTWRERKMLFNRVFGTEFRGQLLYKMDP